MITIIQRPDISLKLRQLNISANNIDFNDLTLLLRQCQSTLEILKLRFTISYIIDGRILELFKQSLNQFCFYFFCHSLEDLSISLDDLLSSFQSSLWLHDQSVMFFTNSFYQTYTIVPPPYHCRRFSCSLIDEFLNYRLNNPHEDIKMPRIKRIFLNDQQQPIYTYQFFRVLKSIFINLQILESGSNFHLINSSKADVKLSTVYTLIKVTNQDHQNVKRIIKLLPKLRHLFIVLASTNDFYSTEAQEQNKYHHLQEIIIYFQPNQRIQLDDDFKNRVKPVYSNAKISS
ncbi:unnamed protein product [Didymodactylos carnosus]|uniref:Uncharacterized protein n=1 Tax=Didymodactylos carnosus TaxID=1234261 RepID=A0A814XE30_9BILA|nr:unnamed protein product [Didymodactylos carnosus]CAF1297935.1 unnamed protein product [Didymodactylos carnosus]CAF3981636.1 unnamed protein product [Didymodactylos carnosus]CAF4103424.1 unnamed protein product [Didymodactylos carnosus]